MNLSESLLSVSDDSLNLGTMGAMALGFKGAHAKIPAIDILIHILSLTSSLTCLP